MTTLACLALILAPALVAAAPSSGTEPATDSDAAAAPAIELITIGPGTYLYSLWGHTALRVIDPRDSSDSAYNFGGVDLSEGFFLRMMRGYVRAFVFKSTFAELLAGYSGEDRTITRRALELTAAQATALADRLRLESSGERTYYAYHHFYDNCSTRVADEIDRATGGQLSRETATPAPGTYRSRVLRQVRGETMLYVALDLSYSSVVDGPMTRWQTGFLCEALGQLSGDLHVDGRPLVKVERPLYRSLSIDPDSRWTWPWIKIYILFVGPLCLLALARPRAGAMIFGLVAGTLGTLLVVLWIGTTYDFFHGNWNVLTLPPAHLGLALSAVRRAWWQDPRWARLRRGYLLVHSAILIALLVASASGSLVQAIGPALGLALPPALILAAAPRRRPG